MNAIDSEALKRFFAKWKLREADSKYQAGSPPRNGFYTMSRKGDKVRMEATWTTQDGGHADVHFEGTPDGQPHPPTNPGPGVDAMSMTLVDDNTLETVAFKSGKAIATGRRVLSEDGQRLVITQSGTRPDGTTFENVSVYERMKG